MAVNDQLLCQEPGEATWEKSAPPAAQVLVLGMHRSGTSAITNLLRSMGFWAGDESDFPPADDHNQAGYWEHRGVWSINEEILGTLGASWCEVADLDLSRLEGEARAGLRDRARELLRDLDRHGSWVIKDPRLCLLLPFWREVLERPFCVLIYREPLPVARSLAARDGFPIPFGIALWETYTREALRTTRGLPRILISHQELMLNPEATLRRLRGALVRRGPELADCRAPSAQEIRAVLDPALLHHPHEPEVERSYLTAPQLDLLEALTNGSALDLDPVPPLSAGARDLLAAYQSLQADSRNLQERAETAERYARSLHQENRSQQRMRADAERYARSLHQENRSQERMRAEAERYARSLVGESEKLVVEKEKLVAEKEKLVALQTLQNGPDLQRALSWIDELDAIISAILESRSWKLGRAITAPLRRLLKKSRIGAPERRDRLMAEVRALRRTDGEK